MLIKSARQNHCQMYRLDIGGDGAFTDVTELRVENGQEKQLWDEIHTPVCSFGAPVCVCMVLG